MKKVVGKITGGQSSYLYSIAKARKALQSIYNASLCEGNSEVSEFALSLISFCDDMFNGRNQYSAHDSAESLKCLLFLSRFLNLQEPEQQNLVRLIELAH